MAVDRCGAGILKSRMHTLHPITKINKGFFKPNQ